MDVATMMRRMEDVGAPVEPEHDFDRLFREDGPGLWRTMVAFTGGRRDVGVLRHRPGVLIEQAQDGTGTPLQPEKYVAARDQPSGSEPRWVASFRASRCWAQWRIQVWLRFMSRRAMKFIIIAVDPATQVRLSIWRS